MSSIQRDGFGSRFGVLVAVSGSAVGLGNLWRFPYLVGNNGGAAFILIYLFFIVVLSLPIMLSEFVIGRSAQSNAFGAMKKLAPKSGWISIGVVSVVASLFILAFYSVVGGWTLHYMINSLSNNFLVADSGHLTSQFNSFTTSLFPPLLSHLFFLAITALIVLAGIKNGIERYSKVLMPALFVMVVLLAIRSLTLPGAQAGLQFLFKPDFSKIGADTILAALGQAFFSLSLGMGCIITYGSYVDKSENLITISFWSATADTAFAIIAGLAVIPAVFAFGISPSEGPGLVFIALPQVFAQLPFGGVVSLFFFFMLLIAALSSAISLLEVVVAFVTEELKWSRATAVLSTFLLIALLGSLSSLSQGVLANVTLFGKGFFDFFDYTSSNILLPLGGLLIVLFVGWCLSDRELYDELSSRGLYSINLLLFNSIRFIIRWIAPTAIAVVLLNSLLT